MSRSEQAIKELIALGRKPTNFPEHLRNSDNRVYGCTASLWIAYEGDRFYVDSDSVIARGIARAAVIEIRIKEKVIKEEDFEYRDYLSISRRSGLSKVIGRVNELYESNKGRAGSTSSLDP